MSDFVRRMIPVPQGEVAVLDFGDPARPVDVLFSHGNGFNALTHAPALGPLAKEMRILAIDQRGHGRTRLPTPPERREGWQSLRDDLLVLMDALALTRPVVLAGHSMGSVISLLASVERPEAVKSVLMFDPVVPLRLTPPEEFGPGLLRFIESTGRRRRAFASKAEALVAYDGRGVFKTWPAEVVEAYVEDGFLDSGEDGVTLACTPEWEVANYYAQGQDTRNLLLATDVPVHILKAGEHSSCSLEDGGGNRRLKVEAIPGTTHSLPMERPALVQAALRAAVG